jgi:putative heme-binding domain-containing protein
MKLPAATRALEGLLKGQPAELRIRAARALGEQLQLYSSGDEPAMKALERLVRDKSQDPAVREAAAEGLAGTYHGTLWLLDRSGQHRLPEDLQPAVARLLRNSPFGDVRERAQAAFPAPRLNPARLPNIAALAQRRGDRERGKQLLAASEKSNLQCLKCHTIQGAGGQIGPDLSVIGQKASRENLFESILYPSKAIADQYLTWVIETKKGLVVTGLIVEETADHVTLRDANGKDTRIDKSDIETRSKSPNSLMPNDLLAYLTEDDLVDLVEYVFSLKEPAVAAERSAKTR